MCSGFSLIVRLLRQLRTDSGSLRPSCVSDGAVTMQLTTTRLVRISSCCWCVSRSQAHVLQPMCEIKVLSKEKGRFSCLCCKLQTPQTMFITVSDLRRSLVSPDSENQQSFFLFVCFVSHEEARPVLPCCVPIPVLP